MTRPDPLLRVADVARWLGMHPETVREWARSGRLPASKPGGRTSPYRFRQSAIEAWLARAEATNARRAG